MIYEIADIEVIKGQETAFEEAVKKACGYFKQAKGCRSLALQKVLETPNFYRLVVGWDKMEDHMVTFRESDDFTAWRALVGPHLAGSPNVVHVSQLPHGF